MQPPRTSAIFFDRDGTLMEDLDYCRDPGQVRVFPGVPLALQRLKAAGFKLILVTNQSGIGRGILTESEFQSVQREFERQAGVAFDGVYFASDVPDFGSKRRKPAPGMLLEAAADHGIDLASSWMIGDKVSDIGAGAAAGTHTILVLTGYGEVQGACDAEFTASSVPAAAEYVMVKTVAAP